MKKLILLLAISFASFTNLFSQSCSDSGGEEGVKIIGYIQPQYEYQFLGDSEQTVMNGLKTPSSFYFNRARLGVIGNIPYDFSYYFLAEFSPTKGGPYVLDAFVTYSRWAPYLKISFGQFKSAFGLELQTPCQDLYTVDRSRVVNELASPFRDFGVMILGSTGDKEIFGLKNKDIFKYYFALTNGTGQNFYDSNLDKDMTARLIFSPFEDISLGGSFRYGLQAAGPDDSKLRYGFDLSVKKYNFLLQSEYIYGKDKGSSLVGGGCGIIPTIELGTFTKDGYWAALMYETKWMLNPIVKYQVFNVEGVTTSGAIAPSTQTEYIVGFNYFFNEWTRFQANYVITKDTHIPDNADYTKNYIVFQTQIKFN